MATRTWKRLLHDTIAPVVEAIGAMSDAELRGLIRAERMRTATNCWWVSYQAAPLLADLARNELRARKNRKALERRALPAVETTPS